MTTNRKRVLASRAAATGAIAAALLALGPQLAQAAGAPPAQPPAPDQAALTAARSAAGAPGTLETLSRFFARDGSLAANRVEPRIEGAAVPVNTLSPEFVAGKPGAPVAKQEFLASTAVASDGRRASVWTVRAEDGSWKVVNIATGDDETRYAAQGARALAGGTVFREPQIDAWYVQRGDRVLPLDEDARRAVGAAGTTLDAYRDRVRAAYADKLPGSAYAKRGGAGGYGAGAAEEPAAQRASGAVRGTDEGPLNAPVLAVAGSAALALGLGTVAARRLRRR
ncbi:hypothetical protein [Streptomyces sp. URMC 123]|uniref:hypothetical protein n=1 Tax=Streptomyces sp. URMC 123 TaxID=3423403 RepID=UPI003F1C099D